jgi:two-component system, cell cycle sensor histidine kinase and response regulator CckA
MGERLETVLVVDDDEAILNVVAIILKNANFNVLKANSGPNALKIANEFTGRIELLLSDVRMPEMSGPVLSEILRQSRPDLNVILMSAFTGGELVAHHYKWPFIEKPFVAMKLVEMINRVLHKPDESYPS